MRVSQNSSAAYPYKHQASASRTGRSKSTREGFPEIRPVDLRPPTKGPECRQISQSMLNIALSRWLTLSPCAARSDSSKFMVPKTRGSPFDCRERLRSPVAPCQCPVPYLNCLLGWDKVHGIVTRLAMAKRDSSPRESNRRHGRVGHVRERTRPMEQYPWSSFHNYSGGPALVDWVTSSKVLSYFGGVRLEYCIWRQSIGQVVATSERSHQYRFEGAPQNGGRDRDRNQPSSRLHVDRASSLFDAHEESMGRLRISSGTVALNWEGAWRALPVPGPVPFVTSKETKRRTL